MALAVLAFSERVECGAWTRGQDRVSGDRALTLVLAFGLKQKLFFVGLRSGRPASSEFEILEKRVDRLVFSQEQFI